MTPQEKAKDLVDKYLDLDNYNNLNLDLFCDECGMSTDAAKQCALIAVDELIKQQEKYNNGSFYPSNYWNEVKQEIEKIII
jgi:hypothetical protein